MVDEEHKKARVQRVLAFFTKNREELGLSPIQVSVLMATYVYPGLLEQNVAPMLGCGKTTVYDACISLMGPKAPPAAKQNLITPIQYLDRVRTDVGILLRLTPPGQGLVEMLV